MIYVFLAEGFEEIEALATVDILRRAGMDVGTVSVTGEREVTGAHAITVTADITEINLDDIDAVILPGGMPGTLNLKASDKVQDAIKYSFDNNKLMCAICAAPLVFGGAGFLKGKKAACYPGFEHELIGADVAYEPVVRDGNIITSRGAGTAHLFAFEILKYFGKEKEAAELYKGMIYG
ncbi:MAG: DJ-1/PfpI family protein [Clostridia bacterium]|nr:DJ-1/PfpI family protein [Clostridia bacterium]